MFLNIEFEFEIFWMKFYYIFYLILFMCFKYLLNDSYFKYVLIFEND